MVRYIADACALIDLAATGREQQLLEAIEAQLTVTDLAYAEVVYLDGPPDEETGEPTRELIDLAPLLSDGQLEVRGLGPAEEALFVRAAERLFDADASCVALAGTMGRPLVTDDAKLRNVARALVPEVQLVGSITLIRTAIASAGLDEAAAATIVRRLRDKARFLPPRHAPTEDREWFTALLGRT